jgi:hypothetical protein
MPAIRARPGVQSVVLRTSARSSPDVARAVSGDDQWMPRLLAAASLAAVAAGGALHLSGQAGAGDAVWAASIVVLLVPLMGFAALASSRRWRGRCCRRGSR